MSADILGELQFNKSNSASYIRQSFVLDSDTNEEIFLGNACYNEVGLFSFFGGGCIFLYHKQLFVINMYGISRRYCLSPHFSAIMSKYIVESLCSTIFGYKMKEQLYTILSGMSKQYNIVTEHLLFLLYFLRDWNVKFQHRMNIWLLLNLMAILHKY